MATGDGVTEWIDVADFTPGIHSGTRSFVTGTPESATDGVAQVRDTWGCVANPNGGLEPAPAIAYRHQDDLTKITVAGHTPTEFSYENDPAGTYAPIPGAARGVRILDFAVVQQTFHEPYETDNDGFVSNPPDTVVLLAHQRYHKITPDRFANRLKAKTYPMNKLDEAKEPTFAVEQLMDDRVEGIRFWGIGNIIAGRSAYDPDSGETDSLLYPHRARIALCMSYWDWPDGDPYSDTGTPSPYGVQWVQITQQFPPISGVFPAKYVASSPIRMVYHQNRIVYSIPTPKRPEDGFFVITRDTFGSANNDLDLDTFEDLFSDELLNYLAVYEMNSINDWDSRNKVYVDSGRPDMIGALISYDTTQLFIVKAQGGGVIVRDSMERPTVSRYPGVESTGYYPHKPVLVPTLGVVYGGVGGVFAWNGGNQSQQLSASLDGTFWLTPENRDRAEGTDEVIGVISPRKPETGVGKFAYLHPYIYTPNNWIMDVRTGGWFRLHPTRELESTDGLDLAYFDVASSGRVYAAEDIQRDTDLAFVQINPKQGSSKFSWRSQPMARQLRGRQLEFKELNAVVSGRGTITVSLVGIDGTTQSKVIEVDADRPTLVVKKYDMRAFDIEVLIQSQGETVVVPDGYEVSGTLSLSEAIIDGTDIYSEFEALTAGTKIGGIDTYSLGSFTLPTDAPIDPLGITMPADDAPGWSVDTTPISLPFNIGTTTTSPGPGTYTLEIARFDIQTAADEHLGYLYWLSGDVRLPLWFAWRPAFGAPYVNWQSTEDGPLEFNAYAFVPGEYTAVGTLKLESAADVGGGYRSGALASDPVVPGLKVAAPQRFDTGVTFTGTSFPAAQTLPDDDASGWTSFGAGQNLSFQLQTPNAGIPAGTISCWIIRYDVQTAAGDHVGYLYKQAYYTSTMTEVGTNSHTIHVWYRSSGTGLLTGPQSQASNRTWAMNRSENRQPAPTMHRFSLGYKPASVANRN